VGSTSWTEHPRLIRIRRRSAGVDVLVRIADGYGRHRTGHNAALLAYRGFLSVFPLLLAMTTILGFVLQNRTDLQESIIDSAIAQIPIIGPTIGTDPSQLRGSSGVLVIGLVLAIWSGMRAFTALQTGLDDVYELSSDRRANFLTTRAQALGGIAVVGGAQVLTAGLNAVAAVASLSLVHSALLLTGAAVINTAILLYAYRYICSATPPWREVLPGALIGGVSYSLLQVFGTTVVARAIAKASPVYGAFASVIALTWWLGLHATIALCGAETNRVLASP